MNPDEVLAAYQRYLAHQNDQRWEQSQYAQKDDRSGLENLGRGAMTGLATAGYNTVGAVGKLLSHMGKEGTGDPLQQWAHQGTRDAQNFYDPHDTAGRVGEMGAEFAGTGAQLMGPGAAMKGFGVGAEAAEGAVPWASRIASKIPLLGKLASSATTGAVAAIPGSALHAGYTALTKDPYDGQSAWGTFGKDEAGAALLGGVAGTVGKLGKRVGSMLGREEPVVGDAIKDLPPAPPREPPPEAPPTAAQAPEPPAPVAPAPEAPDLSARYQQAQGIAQAAGHDEQAATLQQQIDQLAPKAEPAVAPVAEAPAKEAPPAPEAPVATTDTQAKAEVQKPAAKKGKGGPAKAAPVESNSGTGAQGAPKARKSAPAKTPAAAAPAPAATPKTLPKAQPKAKGNKPPAFKKQNPASFNRTQTEEWLRTARSMHEGLSDSPAKTKLAQQIVKAEEELGGN